MLLRLLKYGCFAALYSGSPALSAVPEIAKCAYRMDKLAGVNDDLLRINGIYEIPVCSGRQEKMNPIP